MDYSMCVTSSPNMLEDAPENAIANNSTTSFARPLYLLCSSALQLNILFFPAALFHGFQHTLTRKVMPPYPVLCESSTITAKAIGRAKIALLADPPHLGKDSRSFATDS